MKLQSILKCIDTPTEWVGKAVGWLILALTIIVLYDVLFARYILNSPIIWAWDVTYMLSGSIFMLGGAYILRIGGHIRIDFLQERFSPRTKAIIELLFYVVIFFPLTAVLVRYGIPWAWESWAAREVTLPETMWYGPVYPFKTVLPVAFFLLMIQGVAEFVRNLVVAMRSTGR